MNQEKNQRLLLQKKIQKWCKIIKNSIICRKKWIRICRLEKSGSHLKKIAQSVIINSENGPIDARGLNYLVLYFKDTQESNGMKVSVNEEDGNATQILEEMHSIKSEKTKKEE
ncbi:hypothetical protein [Clostridium butyricum]|uniref:hypothetical protein n=1 Tax=Clostridium butyricum TaxID=1492 RepID=UPI0005427C1F|nr:hypothetical protein [Clostridium butyricum]KHD16329.1 hypothetical protein OA81_04075 [Clostridium butyricum]